MSRAPADVDVTWEDQQRICAFSRMNARMHEINAEIKAKEKICDDIGEALDELALSDESDVRTLLGECFVTMTRETTEERLEQMNAKENEGLRKLREEKKVLADGTNELKKVRRARTNG